MSRRLFRLGIFFLLLPCFVKAQDQTLEVVKLADNVYGMIYSEAKFNPVECNSVVIIGSEYVVVFDSHRSPTASKTTIDEIRKLTDKPVRYVITSHWHEDHHLGNQSYQEAFPDVEFIAHRNTRLDMQERSSKNIKTALDSYITGIPRIETALEKGVRSDGTVISAEDKVTITHQLKTYKEFLPKIRDARLVLPTIVFDDKFTIYQGDREIQLIHFGRANTRGDIVLYLPKEKVVLTGDLLVHPVPFAFGSFISDWIKTMKEVGKLEAQTIVPGHGPVMKDKEYLNTVTALLESLNTQVQDAAKRGLTLEETYKAVNLDSFKDKMTSNDPSRISTWDTSIMQSAINLAYQQAKAT